MEMNRTHYYLSLRLNNRGVTVILVAVVLLVMIGMASLAIDIGYVAVKKNELQNAADAASLAAARKLGEIYEGMSVNEQLAYKVGPADNTADYNAMVSAAQNMAEANISNENNLVVNVEIVEWAGANTQATVKVTVQISIDFFFAKVLGINSMNGRADATAALSAPGFIETDLIPVGISSSWFENFPNYCGQKITLYPVTESCVAWHNFASTSSVQEIKDVLLDMYNFSFKTNLSIGDTIQFFSGIGEEADGDVYDRFRLVYENQNDERGYYIDEFGEPIDPPNPDEKYPKYVKDENGDYLLDGDGNKIRDLWYNALTGTGGIEAWEREFWTNAVVFNHTADLSTCDNPSGPYEISGYARLKIKEVYRRGLNNNPEKRVVATVECVFASQSERKPGGNYYGVNGSVPTLVE